MKARVLLPIERFGKKTHNAKKPIQDSQSSKKLTTTTGSKSNKEITLKTRETCFF